MRKLLIVLTLTTAMVALAGACDPSEGGGSSAKNPSEEGAPGKAERPTPVETVQVAYKEMAAERTAKTSFEITTRGPPVDPEVLGQPDPVTMTGQGAGEVHGASSSMTVEMLGMGGFEMRQIEDTVYIKMPEDLVAQMPGARPWMEADLEPCTGGSTARDRPRCGEERRRTPRASWSTCAASPTPSRRSGWRRCVASGRRATRPSWILRER